MKRPANHPPTTASPPSLYSGVAEGAAPQRPRPAAPPAPAPRPAAASPVPPQAGGGEHAASHDNGIEEPIRANFFNETDLSKLTTAMHFPCAMMALALYGADTLDKAAALAVRDEGSSSFL